MTDCPNCEYHRKRAQLWRDEAYKQAGHPLPERGWVGLMDDEKNEITWGKTVYEILELAEAKLKERNA